MPRIAVNPHTADRIGGHVILARTDSVQFSSGLMQQFHHGVLLYYHRIVNRGFFQKERLPVVAMHDPAMLQDDPAIIETACAGLPRRGQAQQLTTAPTAV